MVGTSAGGLAVVTVVSSIAGRGMVVAFEKRSSQHFHDDAGCDLTQRFVARLRYHHLQHERHHALVCAAMLCPHKVKNNGSVKTDVASIRRRSWCVRKAWR